MNVLDYKVGVGTRWRNQETLMRVYNQKGHSPGVHMDWSEGSDLKIGTLQPFKHLLTNDKLFEYGKPHHGFVFFASNEVALEKFGKLYKEKKLFCRITCIDAFEKRHRRKISVKEMLGPGVLGEFTGASINRVSPDLSKGS